MSTSAPPELPGLMAASGEGRDDAAGHRLADAERVADSERQVADLDLIGIGEGNGRQRAGIADDAQHRQIGALVLEHDVGGELALVGERHLDLIGLGDDVEIGHDQTIGADDDA